MFTCPTALIDQAYTHGEETFPAECCGLILGKRESDGSRTAVQLYAASNPRAAERNERYEITAEDRQAAEAQAKEAGLEVVGFYHSHPDHDSYFSQTDLECSEEYQWGEPWVPPSYSYLVVSIHGAKRSHYKVFIVEEGLAVEQPVTETAN